MSISRLIFTLAALGLVACGDGGGSSVHTTPEPAGDNCPEGGLRVEGDDGLLGYVCFGSEEDEGSSLSVSPEPAGENCPEGGYRLEDAGELVGFVCLGESGESSPAETYVDSESPTCTELVAGTPEMPNCSIRAGLGHVGYGGTVHVAGGSYGGFVVRRDVTLLGGYDAASWTRAPRENESVIREPGAEGFAITIERATEVTFDGFVVENGGGPRGGNGMTSAGTLTLRQNHFRFGESADAGGLVVAFRQSHAGRLVAVGNVFDPGDSSGAPGASLRALDLGGTDGLVVNNVILGGVADDRTDAVYLQPDASAIFLHNTIVGGTSTNEGRVLTVAGNGDSGSVFVNNIFVEGTTDGESGIFQESGSDKIFRRNLFGGTHLLWSPMGVETELATFETCLWTGCESATENLVGDPSFVGGGDFRLTETSDAIGAALDVASYSSIYDGSEDDVDIDGVARPQAAADLGAYVHQP